MIDPEEYTPLSLWMALSTHRLVTTRSTSGSEELSMVPIIFKQLDKITFFGLKM